jgi:poly(A) polymerase
VTSVSTAKWLDWESTGRVVDALGADNMRFVGGAVRDTLLGAEVCDIDIATRLTPDVVTAKLETAGAKVVPTGIAHGTVTAIVAKQSFEVTTLRRDVSTDGRRATVAFTDDWQEDAARRDFTINALYSDASGKVFDYFGGVADLADRRVRFIGDAQTRIREDALRILRFFRFHARFGRESCDPDGLKACIARSNDLMALSRERVRDELLKLLAGPDPVSTVRQMINSSIFTPVLPEIVTERGLEALVEREKRHNDVSALRRLASLIPGGARTLGDFAIRLKLSTAQTKRIIAMADQPPPTPWTDQAVKAYIYRKGLQAFIDVALLKAGPKAEPLQQWLDLAGSWEVPKLPVTGQAFISKGLKPGPIISKAIKHFETLWVVGDFSNDHKVIECLLDKSLQELSGLN